MPELPEVEAVARAARRLIEGQKILACRVLHPIAVRPQSPTTFARQISRKRIEEVARRGKYLLLRLSRGWLALHFRLDGQLVWFDSGRESGHIDVALDLEKGTLGFVDRRHFGRARWLARLEDSPGICGLGMDPLSRNFDAGRLEGLLARSRRPLKLLLMDQGRIAGLGNIYASEALWHARLDPRRRSDGLAPTEARRLHKAIVYVLRRALECCLHPAPDFRNPDWWFEGLEGLLRVYDREGERCRRCGTRIRRVEQGGRSSYFCRGCQR
ncbi:MAG TPA: DNA-formamidopyrimidine glycosylase [Candidatus Acidoferrales bacterium]|nr:DNA-formamidopyrimidine glycosylase [Candidatus Acidoferrales bacterium]